LLEKAQIKTTVANIKPPKFIQKLQPIITQPEQPVVLKGEVDGNPFPDIKWFFNETELSNSERYEMTAEKHNVSLIIKHVKPTDIGIYTCQAINPGGVATSRTNVIVQEPEETGIAPSFITPLKITVPEDKDKAMVTCQVHGVPKPKVKWYKEDVEIVPNENTQTLYDEETGKVVLEVYNPDTNVPVNYTIMAENDYGKAIGKANVFIQSVIIEKKAEVRAPKILKPLRAQVVKPSSSLVFECKYDGLPVPKIKWIKNGKEIVKDENTTIETHEYTSKLEIRNVVKKNAGKYEIIVTNKAGEAKSSGSVVVREEKTQEEVKAPNFIEPLVPKTVAESECVILEATVEAHPIASFQWFYNNTAIVSSHETRVATTDNKSILIIETFDKTHIGSYTCRAENVAGSVTSTATVNILEPSETEEVVEFISPRFIEKAESVQIMDGEKLVLTAKVQATPTPKVEWQHNGDTIQESKDIFTQQDNSGLCTLTIKEVFPEDAGEYVCIAKNNIGEAVSRCIVTVDG
jgi:Immunoglobulin I-set domain